VNFYFQNFGNYDFKILVNVQPLLRSWDRIKIQGADKSLARPGRKQARKHVRDVRDFNNIETRAVIFFFLLGKAQKEIRTILTETLACFLPGRCKDLSAPLYSYGDCTDGASSAVGCRSGFWVLVKAVALTALATSRNLTAGTGCENLTLKFETNRTPVVPEVNLVKSNALNSRNIK